MANLTARLLGSKDKRKSSGTREDIGGAFVKIMRLHCLKDDMVERVPFDFAEIFVF